MLHQWFVEDAFLSPEVVVGCVHGGRPTSVVDEADRYEDPRWILSHNQTKTTTHAGTSDCGCAFIALDGATAVYELLGDEAVVPLIENMIASYALLPREELHVQTHATLSGVRGILRYYRMTSRRELLDLAVRTFDLYKRKAWTDNYANYNWFGLPRWTVFPLAWRQPGAVCT